MKSARLLREARRRAGVTQRQLARGAGVPQPTVARIERGHVVPRVDTLERLLRACGITLEPAALAGTGIDRSTIRELLRLSPAERARLAVAEANSLAGIAAVPRR
ncbi:MAG: helix-turn-helix domain-containing protein [Acidimicrobiia bacterium]